MSFETDKQDWPGESAILLVHGVGNAKRGDYGQLVAQVRAALGPEAQSFAVYRLMYDGINDWFAEKTQLATQLERALGFFSSRIDLPTVSNVMAEVVGDVLWPVLSQSARTVLREAYLAQLKQMVLDGIHAGVPARDQNLHIICHSLGCFHTYEALHAAAQFRSHALLPSTDQVRFRNVVFMASPVQLIRSVAESMGGLISKRWLATLDGDSLSVPGEVDLVTNEFIASIDRTVSIAGALDPVGGHFFRDKAAWAYMDIPGQESIIDSQDTLNINSPEELSQVLHSALREREPPDIRPNNPHSWSAYVDRHAEDIRQWFLA